MADDARYPSLNGRRIVVTGGGSGIGAAIVAGFLRQGARVFALDLAFSDSLGQGSEQIICDLTDLDRLRDALQAIAREGPVDVLVNNAANDDRHSWDAVTPDYWSQRMAVNLRHVFFCTQAVAPGMVDRGSGVILNLGSIAWRLGLANLSLYLTAKAGIEGMTRGLARELGVHGVRVACVVPGAVRTERQMRLWQNPGYEAEIVAQQCLKTRVDPHHVAALVLFLASDDAAMCTAHAYFVDAGWD
jgi:D-xylose 1-dehydrogenase